MTGKYELLDALEEALKTVDAEKRERLAKTIDAYYDDFPEEFLWAIGAQSPALLHHLLMSIDVACRSEAKARAGNV